MSTISGWSRHEHHYSSHNRLNTFPYYFFYNFQWHTSFCFGIFNAIHTVLFSPFVSLLLFSCPHPGHWRSHVRIARRWPTYVDLQLYCQHSLTISQPQTLLHLPPLRFLCVGGCFESNPGQVATSALAVRRSNHSARSHPLKYCKKISKNSHFYFQPIILTLLPNTSAVQKL
jgi:hypothetical protein